MTFAGAVEQFESSRVRGIRLQLEARLTPMREQYDRNRDVLDHLGIVVQLEDAATNYQEVTGRKARVVSSQRPFITFQDGTKIPVIIGTSEYEASLLFESVNEEGVTCFMSVVADGHTLRVCTDTLVKAFPTQSPDLEALDRALFEAYTHHGTKDRKLSDFY